MTLVFLSCRPKRWMVVTIAKLVKQEMESAAEPWSVPLIVDMGAGATWLETKA